MGTSEPSEVTWITGPDQYMLFENDLRACVPFFRLFQNFQGLTKCRKFLHSTHCFIENTSNASMLIGECGG